MRGEVRRCPRVELFDVERHFRVPRYYIGDGNNVPDGVRPWNDCYFQNSGCLGQRGLDLCEADVLAGNFDDVVDPSDKSEASVLTGSNEIARSQPCLIVLVE